MSTRAVEKVFDRARWQSDLNQLEQMISETYPNLESKLANGSIKPFLLGKKAKEDLLGATSDQQALEIFKTFVGDFKDGHFYLDVNGANSEVEPGAVTVLKSSNGLDACEQMMGKWKKIKKIVFEFPTPTSAGFSRVRSQAAAFAWTTITIGKKKVGLVRIVSFGQGDYPKICIDEWATYRKSIPSNCDKKCQETFVYERLSNRLLSEFGTTLKKLEKEGISALVLDLTNNGGGTNWVAGVMRMLTSKQILCGQFGFIRHPHWVKHFEDDRAELQKRIESESDTAKKDALRGKLVSTESDLKAAQQTCDRSKIWSVENYEPACTLTVKKSIADCYPSEELHFESAVYGGPLFILVNNKTASASEDLVGRFKDSGVAKIIGERTRGSGCGFTNGGIKLTLKNSGIRVVMPDCARFMRDGTNEVEGISPDMPLPMNKLNSLEFTSELKNMLSSALPL